MQGISHSVADDELKIIDIERYFTPVAGHGYLPHDQWEYGS